jgi:hypothetical protein
MALTPKSRLLALVTGGFYLYLHAMVVSRVTDTPLTIILPVIGVGVCILIAILGYYCIKLARQGGSIRRIGMSSVLMAFVPISIYCGAIKWFVHAASAKGSSPPDPFPWITFSLFWILWMIVTTAVLLWFGEAIVWLTLILLRKMTRPNIASDQHEPQLSSRNEP